MELEEEIQRVRSQLPMVKGDFQDESEGARVAVDMMIVGSSVVEGTVSTE